MDDHPAGLLALSSRQRYLVLAVVDGIGVVPYVVIGTVRIAAAFVVCHLAGRAYRDAILRDLHPLPRRHARGARRLPPRTRRGRDRDHPVLRRQQHRRRAHGCAPHATRSSWPSCSPIGIAGRLALVWWLAKAFEEPLLDVVDFLQRYQLWAIILSIALVLLVNVRNFRRGRG